MCLLHLTDTQPQVFLKTTLLDQDQDQTGRDQDRDQDQGGQDQDQDQDLKKWS